MSCNECRCGKTKPKPAKKTCCRSSCSVDNGKRPCNAASSPLAQTAKSNNCANKKPAKNNVNVFACSVARKKLNDCQAQCAAAANQAQMDRMRQMNCLSQAVNNAKQQNQRNNCAMPNNFRTCGPVCAMPTMAPIEEEPEDCMCDVDPCQFEDEDERSKRLEDSCADFLSIVHDTVLESVQTSVEKTMCEYFQQLRQKIDCLYNRIEQSECVMNKMCGELMAKLTQQNERSQRQFKCLVQFLIETRPKSQINCAEEFGAPQNDLDNISNMNDGGMNNEGSPYVDQMGGEMSESEQTDQMDQMRRMSAEEEMGQEDQAGQARQMGQMNRMSLEEEEMGQARQMDQMGQMGRTGRVCNASTCPNYALRGKNGGMARKSPCQCKPANNKMQMNNNGWNNVPCPCYNTPCPAAVEAKSCKCKPTSDFAGGLQEPSVNLKNNAQGTEAAKIESKSSNDTDI